jgi:hypothetical protein
VPVVVVRGAEPDRTTSRPEPVVVGVDGSPAGEAAVAFSFEAAALRGVPLVAVHTWRDLLVDATMAPLVDWDAVEADEREVLAERLAGWGEKYPDVEVRRLVTRDRPRARPRAGVGPGAARGGRVAGTRRHRGHAAGLGRPGPAAPLRLSGRGDPPGSSVRRAALSTPADVVETDNDLPRRSSMNDNSPELVELDPDECYRLLATHEIGRLGVNAEHYPLIFPVNYALDRGVIVIPHASRHEAGRGRTRQRQLRGRRGRPEDPERLERARPRARRGADERPRAELIDRTRASGVRPWAPGDYGRWMRIIPQGISGRRIVAGELPPPFEPGSYF